jgi:integrase
MAGKVRTNERCPACGGSFKEALGGRGLELICPSCQTRPSRYYIDARAFRAGKIYKDKRGMLFDSYLAASRQLEEMRAQVDRHTFDATQWVPAKLREYRLEEETKKWIERCKRECSHSYWLGTRNVMTRYLIPSMGKMDVRDVRRSHLENFKASLIDKGLAPTTVKTFVDHVSAFFGWMHDLEVIEKPLRGPSVEIPYKERGWITRDQQDAVLARIAPRHRLLFELIRDTGCRPGEICALRVKDLCGGEISIEKAIDRTGRIKETKSGKVWYRWVPPDLYSRLEIHAKGKFPLDFLFTNRYGLPYRTGGLWEIWRKAAKDVGLPISLYPGTRHSRASQIRLRHEAEMGKRIAEELGNTAVIAMKHYARPRREAVSVECPLDENDSKLDE